MIPSLSRRSMNTTSPREKRCGPSAGARAASPQILLLRRLHRRHALQFENVLDRGDLLLDLVDPTVTPDLCENLAHRADRGADRVIGVDDDPDFSQSAHLGLG